jgi:threonyl-tRNA synthetase
LPQGDITAMFEGRPPLDEVELDTLQDHMQTLVDADLPFEKRKVPLEEAIEIFEQKGETG